MNQQLPKPAELLLHYNYGTAALKQWGKNTGVLTNCPNIPHPPVPALVATLVGEPTRVKHDHSITIWKQDAVMSQSGQGSRSKRKRGKGAAGDLDSEEQDKWDENDMMLFL